MRPAANPNPASGPTPFSALAPVFFYFVIAGVATVMLGPLLPALIQRWQIQDAQAGTLFAASFAGQFCGAWVGARNLRASVLYGAFLTAAGCAAMAWSTFGLAHVALFCVGAGLGAGLTAGNVIVGTAAPSARARLLAMLNVAWSVGAILCPLLVRVSGPAATRIFFFLTSVGLAIAGLCAIGIPRAVSPVKATAALQPEAIAIPAQAGHAGSRLPLPTGTLLMFAAAMLLYIGIENALGGWLPSYATRMHPSARASTIALYFWVAELAGRLLMAAPRTLLGEATLYRACAVLLIVAEIPLIAATHLTPASVVALTILSGLALAPFYPLILSFLLARTGSHPRLGPLFATASLGGATLPWFTGIVSTQFHGLRAGLLVPTFGAVLLLLLSTGIAGAPPAESAA